MKKMLTKIMILLTAVLSLAAAPFRWYFNRSLQSNTARQIQVSAMAGIGRSDHVSDASITVADGGTGSFTATIQLKNFAGKDLGNAGALPFYISTDAAGQVMAVSATDLSALAIGTDGTAIEWDANVSGMLISEADGDIDLAFTVIQTKTIYLNLVMPDGTIVTSDAMYYP